MSAPYSARATRTYPSFAVAYDIEHLSPLFTRGLRDAGRYVVTMRLPHSHTVERRWADSLPDAEDILHDMMNDGRQTWGRNDPHKYRIRDLSLTK